MCPEHVNETLDPAKVSQQMMCAPASLLEPEPKSASASVLRFYNMTDQALEAKLPPRALPGFGTS